MKTEKIRVLLADDHAVVRMGLVTMLERTSDIEVVAEAGNGIKAVAEAVRLAPDVAVIDLVMPKKDGIAATEEIHRKMPGVKILILTSFGTSEEISRAFAAGAGGAVLKSAATSELVNAIRQIASGKRPLSPDIANMMANDPPTQELSPRQREILESITRGLTNNQIATQFGISPESVKTHINKLFEKIGASNRSEAVTIALRKHLLKI